MIDSRIPIVHSFPELEKMRVLLSADLHTDSSHFNEKSWKVFEDELNVPNTFVIFAGDQFEMALERSKSSHYESRMTPREARDWLIEHLRPFKDQILCVIDGNHDVRMTRETSFYANYDLCTILGIEERWRSEGAFVDVGVGRQSRGGSMGKPFRYIFRVNHKAQNLVNFGTADGFEGIDIFVCGHTHKPQDRPLGKLVYDPNHKFVTERNVENFVCGSFLRYGGYGERGGYRPTAHKMYAVHLNGTKKEIRTEGFSL